METLKAFIKKQKGQDFIINKYVQRDFFNTLIDMHDFDCFYITTNKTQYLVELGHEHNDEYDVNDVDEFYTFTNIFNIKEVRL